MLGAMIIVFREVIEAGLIIGIVLAVTQGLAGRSVTVMAGITGGIVGAIIMAAGIGTLSSLWEGTGQEILNAIILALAVAMLGWHNIFMARHGRELAKEMRDVSQSVMSGSKSLIALSIVIGVAVLREGFEVVLFMYGIVAGGGETAASLFSGGFAGLVLGTGVSALTYLGLVKIPAKMLFKVTGWMIAFLAAGMAAQSVSFLEKAGLINALQTIVWDSSAILSESSVLGRVLRTLIGYGDQPTQMQLVAYVGTLGAIFALMAIMAPGRQSPGARIVATA